ncbi:MAG: serine hydrolase [Planctomycetota bacterium]|nr:serine hydrolase [Planctomycetota bacterium]
MEIHRFFRQIVLCVVACSSTPDATVARGADSFDGIDPYIAAALEKWQIPGLAIAVVKDAEIVLAQGYGLCEIGTDRKVTADTAFDIASCEKSFVATCVAILVDEGKLSWDDPVTKHLPEFELSDPYLTEHVTLRDLLCHRTGLRRADLLSDAAGHESSEILRRLKFLEPIAELRTKFIYNNHMYTVLSEVVASASGKSYRQFVAERIFQPLDMRSTSTNLTGPSLERTARRHWRSDAGIVAQPLGEGMFSTVRDMAHWLQLQLSEGMYDGQRMLQAGTIREMQAMQFSRPIRSRPSDNIYAAQFLGSGLGWQIQDYRGHKIVSHSGAWGSKVAMMPDKGVGVVVLSNLDLEYLATLLMHDVFDAYLIGPEATWNSNKWESTWLRIEPPGSAFRPRDEARARLQKLRKADTTPSLPLNKYAGTFHSDLYGQLVVHRNGKKLSVTLGDVTTALSHWEDDSFYVRSPTRLTYDWLLTFGVSNDGETKDVTITHVGWDSDEKDHVFTRTP